MLNVVLLDRLPEHNAEALPIIPLGTAPRDS